MRSFTIEDLDNLTEALRELSVFAEKHTKDIRIVNVYAPEVIGIDYIDERAVVKIQVKAVAHKEYSYKDHSPRVKLTYCAYFSADMYEDSDDMLCSITDDYARWLDDKCMGTKEKKSRRTKTPV